MTEIFHPVNESAWVYTVSITTCYLAGGPGLVREDDLWLTKGVMRDSQQMGAGNF